MKRIKLDASTLQDAMTLTEKLHDGRFERFGTCRELTKGDLSHTCMILSMNGDGVFSSFTSQPNVSYSPTHYGEFSNADAEYYIKYTDKFTWEIKPDLFEFISNYSLQITF